MSGLRMLMRGPGDVRLSTAACAVLWKTSRAFRACSQQPWEEEAPAAKLFSYRQNAEAAKAEALPRGTYIHNPTEEDSFTWPIYAPQHLSRRIITARRHAARAISNGTSAPAAMDVFFQHIRRWFKEHSDMFNPIVTALAMLSVAHLASKHQVCKAQHNEAAALAAVLLKCFLSQPSMQPLTKDSRATANVFWACARLRLRLDEVEKDFQDKLALRYLDAASRVDLQGISNVLWSCSTLRINPLKGQLLASLVSSITRQLPCPAAAPSTYMQSLSVIMCALATLRLHVHPSVAEAILTQFYRGALAGTDEPQGLGNILWASAALGYSPAPHMIDQFMSNYSRTQKPFVLQNDSLMVYSLAVLGRLTMPFFLEVVQRLPKTQLKSKTLSQLYMGLQALRPEDSNSLAHKHWLEVTCSVQHQWPLPESVSTPSSFEFDIYIALTQMGYHALPSHQSEDGLHDIDMALLPQKNLRHKVAVEADGWSHYLYEDFGMDSAVKPATRPDGATLFRNAVLRRQGWAVLIVPYFEWPMHAGQETKAEYLQQKIRQAVKEHQKTLVKTEKRKVSAKIAEVVFGKTA